VVAFGGEHYTDTASRYYDDAWVWLDPDEAALAWSEAQAKAGFPVQANEGPCSQAALPVNQWGWHDAVAVSCVAAAATFLVVRRGARARRKAF
jgi:hypothetical protein